MRLPFLLGCLLAVVLLQACSFAPAYQEPAVEPTTSFKETGNWNVAQPQDNVPRGAWWKTFHDSTLDGLEDKVTSANQNLKVAVAQYDEARAAASAARTAYFPAITGNATGSRQTISGVLANNAPHRTFNDYTLGADLSYEIDLWGRVRNTVVANEDQAEASAADLASVELSLHAELASDYFALRGDDEAQIVLDDTVKADQKAVDLTRQRFEGGVAAEADLDQAQTQLENAKTQASDMQLQRAQLEHALAILMGEAPSHFALAPGKLSFLTPPIDPGLPSTLLERRPDIAAAERRVAAANALIGVARAAYFPTLSLTGALGFESATAGNLLTSPALFWSLGPSAALTLFDAGRMSDLSDEARAEYNANVGTYRETVLESYQQVEDNLVALHHLQDEAKSQAAAKEASDRALTQANNRYLGGATTFLDVVIAQNFALQARLAEVTIQVRRLTATAQLIRALGGGWGRPTK